MIRGAIDYFDGEMIGGWVFSPVVPLRDQQVQAFVDQLCIGTGRVETFRQDLADAGLGDGYCGFRFIVSPPPGTAPARVVIKLEGSDFLLLQRGGSVIDPATETATASSPWDDCSVERTAWMHRRGWFDRSELDFLDNIVRHGWYERSLDGAEAPNEAKRLFELYRQGSVVVQEALIELRNLAAERDALLDGAAVPVIALSAPQGSIRVADETTSHQCRDDRLLFIDTRTTFDGDGSETARIYRAV